MTISISVFGPSLGMYERAFYASKRPLFSFLGLLRGVEGLFQAGRLHLRVKVVAMFDKLHEIKLN